MWIHARIIVALRHVLPCRGPKPSFISRCNLPDSVLQNFTRNSNVAPSFDNPPKPSKLCVRTPRNPCPYRGAVHGLDKTKRRGKTNENFLHLNLDKMATHTGGRALARHTNKARRNFRSDVPSPTYQNTPTPEVGNTTHGKNHIIVSWMLAKY